MKESILISRIWSLYRENRAEFYRIARYLVVGGWNTLFGIGIYWILILVFGEEKYLWLLIPGNVLAITNAFLCYKYIVFRTRGDGWREYFRCYVVYGASMLFGAAGMWFLVAFGRLHPVPANILLTFLTVIFSYIGHRFYSFGRKKRELP